MGKQTTKIPINTPITSITHATMARISIKLVIDKITKKVVFAEAGKDFVDFLFHLLALPIGTSMSLLSKEELDGDNMEGSLGNVFVSLKSFSSGYLRSRGKASSDFLMNPKNAVAAPFLVPSNAAARTIYTCIPPCTGSVSDAAGATCHKCRVLMNYTIAYVPPPVSEKRCGYVKELVTYIITDDLVVKPTSAASSIAILKKMEITDIRCLEEREVDLDIERGISLLVASMSSKTVLSDIFLGKKRRVGDPVIDVI